MGDITQPLLRIKKIGMNSMIDRLVKYKKTIIIGKLFQATLIFYFIRREELIMKILRIIRR